MKIIWNFLNCEGFCHDCLLHACDRALKMAIFGPEKPWKALNSISLCLYEPCKDHLMPYSIADCDFLLKGWLYLPLCRVIYQDPLIARCQHFHQQQILSSLTLYQKLLHGLVVSTLCWIHHTPKITSPSSLLYLNISRPLGAPSTLIFRCSSSCSQVK